MLASKDPRPQNQKTEKRKKWSAPRLRLLGDAARAGTVHLCNNQETQALSQELSFSWVNSADADEKRRAARQWLDAYLVWLTANRHGGQSH